MNKDNVVILYLADGQAVIAERVDEFGISDVIAVKTPMRLIPAENNIMLAPMFMLHAHDVDLTFDISTDKLLTTSLYPPPKEILDNYYTNLTGIVTPSTSIIS